MIPRRLNFLCRRFGTHCLFHLPLKMGQNVPKRRRTKFILRGITQTKDYNIQEQGESLKSKRKNSFEFIFVVVLSTNHITIFYQGTAVTIK